MAAPGPSRWNSTALPAASGTSSDPETATSVRSVIAAAATPRRRRPPGESGSPLPRTGSGARPQSTSSLGECISGPTMLHVFPSPRRLLIEQALHGTIAPARSQQVPGARRDLVRSLHAVGIRPVVVGAAQRVGAFGNTDSKFDSGISWPDGSPTGARATALRISPTRRSRCRPRRRRSGRSLSAAQLAPELAQQLGQAPAASPQPSLERLAIRVVQRPRIHAGDAPVLRHHRRVVARHRRLAAAADRQAVGTQAGRLHQDVHPLGSDPVNNPNSQLLTLGGNGDAAYSQCRIISISGLEVV